MAIIKQIKKFLDGTLIYPITIPHAVKEPNTGKALDDILAEIDTRIRQFDGTSGIIADCDTAGNGVFTIYNHPSRPETGTKNAPFRYGILVSNIMPFGEYSSQMAYDVGSDAIYRRHRYDAIDWTEWVKITANSDLEKIAFEYQGYQYFQSKKDDNNYFQIAMAPNGLVKGYGKYNGNTVINSDIMLLRSHIQKGAVSTNNITLVHQGKTYYIPFTVPYGYEILSMSARVSQWTVFISHIYHDSSTNRFVINAYNTYGTDLTGAITVDYVLIRTS